MKYVDDKGKPCVFARLRLRSNVHTSDARVGRAVRVERGGGGGGRGARRRRAPRAHKARAHTGSSRSRGGSSLGGASAASRAAVKTATRELCAALRDVHRASAEQLLAHFPAIGHLLLTLIAAPPPAIAAQVAVDAALVASATEARATKARRRRLRRGDEPGVFPGAAAAAAASPTPDSPASDFSVDTPAFSPETFGGGIRV